MRRPVYFLLVLVLFSACDLKFRKDDARIKALSQMQQTDADFALMAKEQGFRKAFLEYMEEEAILLRDNHLPIIGADAIRYITSIDDSSFQISWEPEGGDIAASADMGFTYGIFLLKAGTEEQRGTYITVWRKQPDGRWKYVLDSGTQGLEPPATDSTAAEAN
jgi:ketosteroid isomerase-like protein